MKSLGMTGFIVKHRDAQMQHNRTDKPRVAMMPTLPSLVAPQVVIMTTCGATSDGKVGIMTIVNFPVWSYRRLRVSMFHTMAVRWFIVKIYSAYMGVCFFSLVTGTSHERHGVSNNRQIDCFPPSCSSKREQKIKMPHHWPFVRVIHRS